MILHLLNNDKFDDGIIDLFNRVYPGQNDYIVLFNSDDERKSCNQVGAPGVNKNFVTINELKPLSEYLSKYDVIFIHYLDLKKVEFINCTSESSVFIWMIWGGDAYKFLKDYIIYDHQTREILDRIAKEESKGRELQSTFFNYVFGILRNHRYKSKFFKAIKKIQYCTTIIPEEYQLFIKQLPLKAIFIPFNYGLKDYFISSPVTDEVSNNILVGNSGIPTNNHLSIFQKLMEAGVKSRKIIVPLSYGDQRYINHIKDAGREMFKEYFIPITGFLPYKEYSGLVASCSIFIMNSYRQQGMGNVILLLRQGARLYLREENPAYHYLLQNGLKIFSINEQINFEDLDEYIKIQNRELIEELYGPRIIDEKAKNLLKIVLDR